MILLLLWMLPCTEKGYHFVGLSLLTTFFIAFFDFFIGLPNKTIMRLVIYRIVVSISRMTCT